MNIVKFYLEGSYVLSNFSAHSVEINGVLYPTSEHAYQSEKFNDTADKEAIRSQISPLNAKLISKEMKYKRRKDWDEIKLGKMSNILLLKYIQHDEVRKYLKSTEQKTIQEASPYDEYWGIGKNGEGKNMLGKLWMDIRNTN